MRSSVFFQALVAVSMVVLSSPASARHFRGSETCVTSAVEMSRSLEISKAVSGFGGLDNMLGGWRLAGFAGIFAKTHVTLVSDSNFAVKINGDDEKRVVLCVDASAPDVLKMRVQKSKDPEFSLFLLKPGTPGETVYGACSKSRWNFMKFKRL